MSVQEDEETLEFKARGPVPVFLEDERSDSKSGCSILDLSFHEPVIIKEIRFRNYYTCYVSLLVKKVPAEKDVKNRDLLPWQVSVKSFILMEDPHCEQNSQDIVAINMKESIVLWSGVVQLRIILKQPSFQWKKFGIKDLTIFGELCKDTKQTSTSHSSTARKSESKVSTEQVCKEKNVTREEVQKLSDIAELLKDKQTSGAAVGRFEVDGSYDISHLI